MTATDLVSTNGTEAMARIELDPEKVALIKRTIAKGASDDELALFIAQCNRTGLDPFARQIYCVGRFDGKLRREVFQTQVSIDGARLVAQRSGEYAGQTPTVWTADGITWVEVWLADTPPAAAKVGVYRTGFVEPLWAVATWKEYVQTYRKDGKVETSPMWKKMGALMLGKTAEMLALRKAFPMELSGLYAPEELAQVDNPPAPSPARTSLSPEQTVRQPPGQLEPPADEQTGEIIDAEVVEPDDATALAEAKTALTEEIKVIDPPAERNKVMAHLTEKFGASAGRTLEQIAEAREIVRTWEAP